MRDIFTEKKNTEIHTSLVGPYNFESHKGLGSFTFAPRFKGLTHDPPGSKDPQEYPDWLKYMELEEPYNLENLPNEYDSWTRKMFDSADKLGIHFAPCKNGNWHID